MAGKRKNPHGLTDQQYQFCTNYIADPDLNATRAYMKAYPKCTAKAAEACSSRLLSDAKIMAFMDEWRKGQKSEADRQRELVLEKLQLMVDVGLEIKEVKDKDGNLIGRKFNDVNAGSKGVELLGKHHKMFTDKVEHSGELKLTGVLKIDYSGVSLEDWIKATGGSVEKET